MKVLLVTPYFYPKTGGLENYAYNIAKRLVKRGFDITVLCSNHDRKKENIKLELIDGLKIIRLKPSCIISNTPIRFSLFNTMSKIIKENKFELVNAHTPVPFYADIGAMVCKIYKLPFVLTYHNDNIKNNFPMNVVAKTYNYSFNILTLKLSKYIITPSPYCYNESPFLKLFKNKVFWIPPGVEIEKYDTKKSFRLQNDFNISNDSKIVLFVGQMNKGHEHKGIYYLIKAFRKVKEEIKNAYLVLVGSGDLIPEYKRLCEIYNIDKNVIFTGFIDDYILIEYYRSSDVVVLPSTTAQEGFGMVLIEANACGKPVIGSKIGGIKYVIEDGKTGLLVPPKDKNALADAIIYMLENENLARRMGRNGRKIVEKKYTWNIAVKHTIEVYNRSILK